MNTIDLTPLERDLLRRIHFCYADIGFPAPEELRVVGRENTGAGRYTHLDHDVELTVDAALEGNLAQGTYSQLDMRGMDAGASFHAFFQNQKVRYLEIAVNGDSHWDGSESEWVVCDPQTGAMTKASDWHGK